MRSGRTRSMLAAFSLVVLICLHSSPANASAEGSFQRTLQVTGPVNVDLSTGSGSVNVRTGSSSEVQITARIKASNLFSGNAEERIKRIEANPPIQQSGNDIRIGHIDDPELMHNISISYDLSSPGRNEVAVAYRLRKSERRRAPRRG